MNHKYCRYKKYLNIYVGILLFQFQIARLDQVLNDFGPCSEQRERDGYSIHTNNDYLLNPIDEKANSAGVADVAVVLDTSVFAQEDREYMKQVAASVGETDLYRCSLHNGLD